HPQQGDDGGRAAALRRYHARARRQPPGVGGPGRSREARRRRLSTAGGARTERRGERMSDAWILRTAIIAAGLLLMGAIYFFGRPGKPGQGRRVDKGGRGGFADGGRREPTLGEMIADELADGAEAEARQAE